MGKRRGRRHDEEYAEDWENQDLEGRGLRRREKAPRWQQHWQQVALSAVFLFLFWRAYFTNPNGSCPKCDDCSLALREYLQQQNDNTLPTTADSAAPAAPAAPAVPASMAENEGFNGDVVSSAEQSTGGTIQSAPLGTAATDGLGGTETVANQNSETSVSGGTPVFGDNASANTAALDASQGQFKLDLGVLTFYGQDGGGHNQPDKIVFENFFKDPPVVNGIFVEVGAQDGLSRSNTLFFEETLNWNGILVEAATPNYEKLKDAQSKRRKNSQIVHAAACPKEGTVKFIGDGGTAGRVDRLAPAFVEKWSRYWKSPWNEEYEVPCEPMSSILSKAGLHQIDFISIDAEGSELDFLETTDFDIVMIRVLVFESGMDVVRDALARDLLHNKGFCHAFDVSTNQYWVKDPALAKKFCTNL
eukprot:Plantae.Rhodophyta-Purpureofilum_apyrenoidigerum.ctg21217.p1 GENE.Plantae.Rhodophyta-Purpureofilum_apyrenoidigerum.ctg21217~~Plantae.Rhodophyta-Purpureofilum_apyrenoidigerum.ctg21217.p1  ORF type:complete len:417 (-),score=55.78 Plantae.Rhodophyta-Purpureofilum_apyrenoidigerum.ctg21217:372-1622(-)